MFHPCQIIQKQTQIPPKFTSFAMKARPCATVFNHCHFYVYSRVIAVSLPLGRKPYKRICTAITFANNIEKKHYNYY
jgi:hypothetical protein